MQVTILAIVMDGVPSFSLHQTQSAAWGQLIGFIDANWRKRMGSTPPPDDEDAKARMFFRPGEDDLYSIINADVSELHEALESVRDPVRE